MENSEPRLLGLSLIGDKSLHDRGAAFQGVNPLNVSPLEPRFYSATKENIDLAVSMAKDAFPFSRTRAARRVLSCCGESLKTLRLEARQSSTEPIWKPACQCLVFRGSSVAQSGN